ncbi:MAG: hypothetical protein KAG84_03835 [Bacteroidales bacterium]|nr:hypothetical protein [Bacteroidales bacterium]
MKKYFIILIISIVAFTSCTKEQRRFKLTVEEASKQASEQAYVISPQLLADILYSGSELSSYKFIDLRNPSKFENGHIEGAINIPFRTMNKNNNCKTFISQDRVNIIYGESTEQAIFAGFFLQQLGIKNYFIILGNYDFIKNNIIEHYNIYSAQYNPEIAQYDYAKIVSETSGARNYSAKSKKPSSAVTFKRKKKAAAGGGCD